MTITLPDGKSYDVARSFGDARAIINYEGLFVLVDKDATGQWDLSQKPADGLEKSVLVELTADMTDVTVTTITKEEP